MFWSISSVFFLFVFKFWSFYGHSLKLRNCFLSHVQCTNKAIFTQCYQWSLISARMPLICNIVLFWSLFLIFILDLFILFSVWILTRFIHFILPEYMSVSHVSAWFPCESQENMGILRLELWMVVNHHWILGIKPRSSTKATSALDHWVISLTLFYPWIFHFFYLYYLCVLACWVLAPNQVSYFKLIPSVIILTSLKSLHRSFICLLKYLFKSF